MDCIQVKLHQCMLGLLLAGWAILPGAAPEIACVFC